MTDKSSSDKPDEKKHRRAGRRMNVILSCLLVAAIATGGFWYWQYRKTADRSPESEQRRWTAELSRFVIMPEEKPLISTIIDKSKLSNEILQKQAQNGDRLYIFAKAERLILYRPSSKRVVNMLTIQSGQSNQTSQSNKSTEPVVKSPATPPGQ